MLLDFHQKKFQEKGQKESYENSNGIYIVFFGRKKVLRVGRAHDLEVNINDISVSRSHATFKQVSYIMILRLVMRSTSRIRNLNSARWC